MQTKTAPKSFEIYVVPLPNYFFQNTKEFEKYFFLKFPKSFFIVFIVMSRLNLLMRTFFPTFLNFL